MYQDGMRTISVKVPKKIIEIIDLFVEAGLYSTRSEFVREALRLLIQRVMDKNKNLISGFIDEKALSLILGQATIP
ncbi:MAG: ribbon-helix-helix domain-containing protein [Candidatus Njordarchaeota archaeon]